MGNKNSTFSTYKIVFVGIMAAIVCVVTFFRFPFLGSKVHFANAMCLLSGLLFGPLYGGLAAGFGSGLYDALFGGYDLIQSLITFVSKFAMAWLCAKLAYGSDSRPRQIAGSVAGAWLYVALYMLKTYIYQKFVYGYPADTVWAAVASKFPASAINAVFAMIASPILFALLKPALERAGVLRRIQD